MDVSTINSPNFTITNRRVSPSKGIMQNLKKSIFSNKNSIDFVKKWNKKDVTNVKIKQSQLNNETSKQISIENCLLLSQRKQKWSPNKSKLEKVKSMVARKG